MSKQGRYPMAGNGMVIKPMSVGPGGSQPMNDYGYANGGQSQQLEGDSGASANRANLMQGKRGSAKDDAANGYFKGINVLSPSFYQDAMYILPTIFNILSKRPEGHSHPFLSAAFEPLFIGSDTAGIVQRRMSMVTTAPQIVGAHTGGPTFNFNSTGGTGFPVDLGLTHMFPTKALRNDNAQALLATVIKASLDMFDEEKECMILALFMSVICKPLDVIVKEREKRSITLSDLLDEFFNGFAVINKHPQNVFERLHSDTADRLRALQRNDPDFYIGTMKQFVVKNLYSSVATFANSGEKFAEIAKIGPKPVLVTGDGSAPFYEIKFFKTPLSNVSALQQYATIGSVAVQTEAVDFEGIERHYHGDDGRQTVTYKEMWENVKHNFFTDGGKLKKISFNKPLSLLEHAKETLNDHKKSDALVGCFYDSNFAPLEKIGNINEKFLDQQVVKNWIRKSIGKTWDGYFSKHFNVWNAAKHAKTTGGGEFSGDKLDHNGETRANELLRKVVVTTPNNPSEDLINDMDGVHLGSTYNLADFIVAVSLFDAEDGDKIVSHFIKNVLQNLDKETFSKNLIDRFDATSNTFGDAIKEFAQMAWNSMSEFFSLFGDANATGNLTEAFNFLVKNETWKNYLDDSSSLPYKRLLFDYSKELKGSGGDKSNPTTSTATFGSNSFVPDFSSFGGAAGGAGTKNHADFSIEQRVEFAHKVYLNTEITADNFDDFLLHGVPFPYNMILWTPHITYGGHATIGVVAGAKTGYLGVSEVNTTMAQKNNFQTQVDLDIRMIFYVPGQEGIVRRDMTVVTEITKKDDKSFLSIQRSKQGENNLYDWVPNPMNNHGNHFVTFNSWKSTLPERCSFFGYYFIPTEFISGTFENNKQFHHCFAPYVLMYLNQIYSNTITKQKTKSMFVAKSNVFGLVGICVQESYYTKISGKDKRFEKHIHLWPGDESWFNNNRRTGKQPGIMVTDAIAAGGH